jgi:hypothetical protein
LGFDHRFGYRAQPLREMVFCKGAKGKWTKSSLGNATAPTNMRESKG